MKRRVQIFRRLSSEYTRGIMINVGSSHEGRNARESSAQVKRHESTSENGYIKLYNVVEIHARSASRTCHEAVICERHAYFIATGHYAMELIRCWGDCDISRRQSRMEINCTTVNLVGFITRAFKARPNLSENP